MNRPAAKKKGLIERIEARLAGPAAEGPGAPPAEWPDEAEEAAFLSQAASQSEEEASQGAPAGKKPEKLPPLESLVGRVPPKLAGLLDELFRAKFTGVRRVSEMTAPGRD